MEYFFNLKDNNQHIDHLFQEKLKNSPVILDRKVQWQTLNQELAKARALATEVGPTAPKSIKTNLFKKVVLGLASLFTVVGLWWYSTKKSEHNNTNEQKNASPVHVDTSVVIKEKPTIVEQMTESKDSQKLIISAQHNTSPKLKNSSRQKSTDTQLEKDTTDQNYHIVW